MEEIRKRLSPTPLNEIFKLEARVQQDDEERRNSQMIIAAPIL
jgi:hypothetical protein